MTPYVKRHAHFVRSVYYSETLEKIKYYFDDKCFRMRLGIFIKLGIYIIFSDGVWPLIKYNMQPSDWHLYRDLVMTSPYDDVSIYKLQYATTWLVEHTGWGEGKGGRQAVTERSEKKKEK